MHVNNIKLAAESYKKKSSLTKNVIKNEFVFVYDTR